MFEEINKLDISDSVLAYTDEFNSVFSPSGFTFDGTYYGIVDRIEIKIYRFRLE